MIDPGLHTYVALNLVNIGANILFAYIYWVRDRSVYSPGLIIELIIFYMFNLRFALEGYDHPIYARIPIPQLVETQVWITCVVIFAQFVCLAGTRRLPPRERNYDPEGIYRTLLTLGTGLLAVNVFWRLGKVGWDLDSFVAELLLSRASEAFTQQENINSGSPVDSLIRVTFGFVAYAYAISCQSRNLMIRLVSHALLGVTLILLVLAGSRAAFLAPIFLYLLMWVFQSRNKGMTALIVAPVAFIALYLSSIVLDFRSVGLEQMEALEAEDVSWHMDDNYPRLVYAAWLSWDGTPRVDAGPFLLLSLLNFVPRAIWPSKLELPAEYFYPYIDVNYLTITSLGELHAVAHPVIAALAFVGILWLMMQVAYRIYRNSDVASFALYVTYLLYCYAIMRSLLAFSAAIYIPALMVLVHYFATGRRGPKARQAPAPIRRRAAGAGPREPG